MSEPSTSTTILAATDLLTGSRKLYTIAVGVFVILILIGGGARATGAFFGGRKGETVVWAMLAIVVAVFVGSGYAIYMSLKKTTDQSDITTGQFG
ncbi:glycosyl transferase family 39 [Mycobacterium sp. WUMAC-067]|nr:glycosyl transferase family 39 [Mycobacterium sp. WUMAC-067]